MILEEYASKTFFTSFLFLVLCFSSIALYSLPEFTLFLQPLQFYRLHTLRRDLRILKDEIDTHRIRDKLDLARLAFNSFQPFVEEPYLVLKPKTVRDLRQILKTANEHDISVNILGGGHHGAGWCLSRQKHSFVIQLKNFQNMQVLGDGEFVKLGAGLEWGEVYRFVDQNIPNKVVVGGMDHGVGIIGYLLSGGLGYFSRLHGYAADSVVQWDIILGNGTLLELTQKSNPELHSVMKGSVGIPFGIVIGVTLKTYPRQKPFGTSWSWRFSREEFVNKSVLKVAGDEIAQIPDPHLVAYQAGGLLCPKEGSGEPTVDFHMLMFYSGPDQEDGMKLIVDFLNRLAEALGKREIESSDLYVQRDYTRLLRTTTAREDHLTYLEGGGFIRTPVSEDTLSAYNDFMQCESWTSALFVNFEHLGGNILNQKYEYHPSWSKEFLSNTFYVSWYYSASYFNSHRVHVVRQSVKPIDEFHLAHYAGYFYPLLYEGDIPFDKIYYYSRSFYQDMRQQLGAEIFTSYILEAKPASIEKFVVPISCRSWRQEGKVVVMTGGTSGMGLVLAKQWLQAGVALFIAARNVEKCQGLLPGAVCIKTDLLDQDAVINFAQELHKRLTRVDVVYLGAAMVDKMEFVEGTKILKTVQVNFLSILMIILLLSQFEMISTSTTIHIPMTEYGDFGASSVLWELMKGTGNKEEYFELRNYVATKALLRIAKDLLLYNNIANPILQLPTGTSRSDLSGPWIEAYPELFDPSTLLPAEANVEPFVDCLFCGAFCRDHEELLPIQVSLEEQCELMKYAFSLISFQFALECMISNERIDH